MTINERIRTLRKDHLKMNQTDFALLIGMKQTSVSSFEKPNATVTDQTIKSICLAVDGLSEKWLRTGDGEMIIEPETFSLDEFVKQHGGTEIDLQIVKTYFELPPEVRTLLIERFRNVLAGPAAVSFAPAAAVPASAEDMTVEEAEELYKKSVLSSAQNTGFTASSITSDTNVEKKVANEN